MALTVVVLGAPRLVGDDVAVVCLTVAATAGVLLTRGRHLAVGRQRNLTPAHCGVYIQQDLTPADSGAYIYRLHTAQVSACAMQVIFANSTN